MHTHTQTNKSRSLPHVWIVSPLSRCPHFFSAYFPPLSLVFSSAAWLTPSSLPSSPRLPSPSLSSHFLHHDPLLCLVKPVFLSFPLTIPLSTQPLILCFLIQLRETPRHPVHPSFPPLSQSPLLLLLCFFHLVHFFFCLHKQGKEKKNHQGNREAEWEETEAGVKVAIK